MTQNRQDVVAQILETIDAVVKTIPEENDCRRADYRVTLDDEVHIIEVKTRGEDEKFEKELRTRGFAEWKPPDLEYSKQLAKRIRHGEKQIQATPQPDSEFNLVAIVLGGMFKDTPYDQLLATIYGRVDLFDLESKETFACYFFGKSWFMAGCQLNGVIVAKPDHFGPGKHGAQLCLNPFSDRAEEFRHSRLATAFSKNRAFIDPIESDKCGRAFLFDEPSIPFDKKGRRQSYIQQKYNRPMLTIMHPGAYNGAVSVDLSELSAS